MRKRRFSEEQIVRILREAERGDQTVAEVARSHGVAENSIYRWRQKYAGLSVPETRHLRELEQGNGRLKRLLAERDLRCPPDGRQCWNEDQWGSGPEGDGAGWHQ